MGNTFANAACAESRVGIRLTDGSCGTSEGCDDDRVCSLDPRWPDSIPGGRTNSYAARTYASNS
jgi:hypothetical protein